MIFGVWRVGLERVAQRELTSPSAECRKGLRVVVVYAMIVRRDYDS